MGKRRGNREGTVYQRGDGRWCGQLTVGDNRETFYGSTQEEVQDKILKRRQELQGGLPVALNNLTVSELAEHWLTHCRPQLSTRSAVEYQRDTDYLKPHVGHLVARNLTVWDVAVVYERLIKAGRSADQCRSAGVRLRQILSYGVRVRVTATNPALDVPLPRVSRKEMRPLRSEEVTRFLKTAQQHRLFALFVLALDTGARLGELLVLDKADWNAVDQTVRFVKTLDVSAWRSADLKPKESKTRASRRTVQVSKDTAVILTAHLAASEPAVSRMFPNRKGWYYQPYDVSSGVFKRLLRSAELPDREIRFHDLRHTCATLLLLAGVDIKTVSVRLGHSTPTTTLQTYAHVLPEMEARAASAIGGLLRAGLQ
jgi:integrase